MENSGEVPDGFKQFLRQLEKNPNNKLKDEDIRNKGLKPSTVNEHD